MGDTPGISSRGLSQDSGSTFDQLQPDSRDSAGTSLAPRDSALPFGTSEDLRESGREAAARLDWESPPVPSLLTREAPPTLDFSASYAAQAFFATPLSTSEYNAENLDQALEHFRFLYGNREGWEEMGAEPSVEHQIFLRRLANQIRSQNPEQPSVETRWEEQRLLAEAYSELLASGGPAGDRSALVEVLVAWLQDFSSHPLDEATRIADLSHIAALVERHGLGEVRAMLRDAVQTYADEWRHRSGDDPRLAIQGRQYAFLLLSGTHEVLGEIGAQLFQDLLDDLNRDAVALENQAREAEAGAGIQILGEVAALYRLMARHPEAAEFYQARVQSTLTAILEAAESEAIPAPLRLQVHLQVLQELESSGSSAQAAELRRGMLARAERELAQGRNRRGSVLERYQSFSEAQGIFSALGESSGIERSEAAWRNLLREMQSVAGQRENPELTREVGAFCIEASLQMGDLAAVEEQIAALRQSLQADLEDPEISESAEPGSVDPRAQWLLRLGGYAQSLATSRAEGSEAAPDFALFRELLADLSALGARSGQRTMALYGRFMRAVLDQDPAAESIYEDLRDWRPAEFEAWGGTPAFFLPEEFQNYAPDPFQRMAEEIWRAQAPMATLPRAATTLQFLSLLIEGNYAGQIAAAEEEGGSTLPIREERDEMRRYLSHVQALLVSGQASSTREAVEMLPNVVGHEDAARRFYRNLGRAFGYTDLVGREHGDSSFVSRLIDSEAVTDPEIRAQTWLRLAREMIVADSLNHRADGLIGALLESAEEIGGAGRAPRPLTEILANLMRESRDLNDFAELHNRLAGNETLREQIQATRDAGLYVQTMNQVVDSVFSVEGGLIMIASIFTGGLAAELAGAALIARLGATAFTVVNGVSRMTWAARIAVGATRIGAAWAARSATELGGIAVYRGFTGHRQMNFEELRVRVITSLFCSIGDEFATHLTRALLSRALRPLWGETARGLARSHALTEVAEFFTSGLGEMWGEEVGARVAGQAVDTRPFLVRFFEETLHGSFFVAGMRTAAPVAEAAGAGWQYASSLRPTLRLPNLALPSFHLPNLARIGTLGSMLGLAQAFQPQLTMASVGLAPDAALSVDGTFLGSAMALMGLGAMAMATSGGSRRNRPWWQSIFRIFQSSISETSVPESTATPSSDSGPYRDTPASQARLQAQRRKVEVLLEQLREGDVATARQSLSHIEPLLNELPQQERLDLVAAATDLWTRRDAELSREVSERFPQLLGHLNEEQCGLLGMVLAGQLRRRMPRDFSSPLIEAIGLVATQSNAGDLAGIEQEVLQQTGLRLTEAVDQAQTLKAAQNAMDRIATGEISERIRAVHDLATLIPRLRFRENRAEFIVVLLSLQNHPLASLGQAAFQAALSLLPLSGTAAEWNEGANLFAGPEAVLPSDSGPGGDTQGFHDEGDSSREESLNELADDEGLAVALEIHPTRGIRPLHGTLALGSFHGTESIRRYRVLRLFQSGGQTLVELESLSAETSDTCLAFARGQEIRLAAGQEVRFIPAIEGGSGRREPESMFFPLMLSQYALHEDEPAPGRLELVADPERPERFITTGYGFRIFRNQNGRIRGREPRAGTRLTLFDPGSRLAVDSYLPLGTDDTEVFLEDFRFLRDHLEEMGFDWSRARNNLVYADGNPAAIRVGQELATRLTQMGVAFESIRPASQSEEILDFDLSTGALLGDSEELFNPATAPTLPPSAPTDSEGPNFYLFDEWLDSAELLAANQPELESFTRQLGRDWEQRRIGFPEMIRRLRDFIREATPAETQPGLFASLASVLAREGIVTHAHVILETENLSLEALFPEAQGDWDSEESLARVQLIRALVNDGIFEGDINPVYHLARIQNSGARYLAWRDLMTALVVRGQVQRARELLLSFERNPRIGTPVAERAALWDLLGEIVQEVEPGSESGNGGNLVSALLAAGAGAATLLSAEVAQASFGAGQDGGSLGLTLGLGVAALGVFSWGASAVQRAMHRVAEAFRQASESATEAEGNYRILLPSAFLERGHYRDDAVSRVEVRGERLPGGSPDLIRLRLEESFSLEGNRLEPGTELEFDSDGRLLSLENLGQDFVFRGRRFPGVSRIHFRESGELRFMSLRGVPEFPGIFAERMQNLFFHPDGGLAQFEARNAHVFGYPCEGEVLFHLNGRLKALTLRRDTRIRGILFRAGHRLHFSADQGMIRWSPALRDPVLPLRLGDREFFGHVHLQFNAARDRLRVTSFENGEAFSESFDPVSGIFGPDPGSRGFGYLSALLAAGAGLATWLGAGVAEASFRIAEAASGSSGTWAALAAAAGLGALAMASGPRDSTPRPDPQSEASRLARLLNSEAAEDRLEALLLVETWLPESPEEVRLLLLNGVLHRLRDADPALRRRAQSVLRAGLGLLTRDQVEYFALNIADRVDFEEDAERSAFALDLLDRAAWLAGRAGFLRISAFCEDHLGFGLPGLAQQLELYRELRDAASATSTQARLRRPLLPGLREALLGSLPPSAESARGEETALEIGGVEVDLEVHPDFGVRSRPGRLAPGLVVAPGKTGSAFFRVARILRTGNRELLELGSLQSGVEPLSLLVAEGQEGRWRVGDELTFFPEPPESENPPGGSALTALLAAGAGAATWLGAEVAQASLSLGEVAASDAPAWWAGAAAFLSLGLLGTLYSGNHPPRSEEDFDSLAEMLFQRGFHPRFSEEARIERFLTFYYRGSPEEKDRYASEVIRALERTFPENGTTPLSVHIPYLELLVKQQDPRHARELFAALGQIAPHPKGYLGTALDILQRGLLRRAAMPELPTDLRSLQGGESRHFRTPAWLSRLRESLGESPETLESRARPHSLENILPIHYLDAHQSGAGVEALNGVRRNILHRLALQGWQPGTEPGFSQLAAALVDKENRLPILSQPGRRESRLLLNGHHRIGALLTLVADGHLPEETLERVPFHVASEIQPEPLLRRAFARGALPNPRFALNWQELLGFDETTRRWLETRAWGGDLVAWIRSVRVSGRGN